MTDLSSQSLVERLRRRTPSRRSFLYGEEGNKLVNPDGPEAAERIETLEAWASGPDGVRWYIDQLDEANARIEALEAASSTPQGEGDGKEDGRLGLATDRATHEQSPQAVSAVPVGSADAGFGPISEWAKPTPSYATIASFGDLSGWFEAVRDGHWNWCVNSACKYVTIHLDTRAGAYALLDRDDNEITFAQLTRQRDRHVPAQGMPAVPETGEDTGSAPKEGQPGPDRDAPAPSSPSRPTEPENRP